MQEQNPVKRRTVKKRMYLLIGSTVTLIILGIGLLILRHSQTSKALPNSIVSQVNGFKVYFFDQPLPDTLKLDAKTAHYNGGLLTFNLRNKSDQLVTVSEQALPTDLTNATPEGVTKVDSPTGKGVVAIRDSRTIGTVLTKDHQTLILLNGPSSISTDTFKDLIQNLRPL